MNRENYQVEINESIHLFSENDESLREPIGPNHAAISLAILLHVKYLSNIITKLIHL